MKKYINYKKKYLIYKTAIQPANILFGILEHFTVLLNYVGAMSVFLVSYLQTPETSFVRYIYGVFLIKAINVFWVYYSWVFFFFLHPILLYTYFIIYNNI